MLMPQIHINVLARKVEIFIPGVIPHASAEPTLDAHGGSMGGSLRRPRMKNVRLIELERVGIEVGGVLLGHGARPFDPLPAAGGSLAR